MANWLKNVAEWCGKHSKAIATAATITGGLIMAIGGVASAHSQEKLMNETITKEIDKRLPPVT